MEKYRLVGERKSGLLPSDDQQSKVESTTATASTSGAATIAEADSSEVRITQQGKPRNYISYAISLLVSGCVFFRLGV